MRKSSTWDAASSGTSDVRPSQGGVHVLNAELLHIDPVRGWRLAADEPQERGIMFEIECAAREEDAQFRIPRGLQEQFVE